ncbi:protein COFACTOR ASSEMBLY OF COMPLEX C SUBUNIT B CCB2, chloroplastic [Nymphaea colorata]|nr:protein COFACTOR ASSEMBLY OF COMPLEX C SUBUNIT B CCB2, chloroplastic [Nymphaea colorata]
MAALLSWASLRLPSRQIAPPPPFCLARKTFTSVFSSPAGRRTSRRIVRTHVGGSDSNGADERKQVDLSVLRFTLGIPGFDESYLPRWIGFAAAFLLLLNHFLSPNLVSPSQLRSEALGLLLASFSVSLPYLGKFLTGAHALNRSTLPEENRQIFAMSENLSETQKENFAWGSYILLRNTNSMSVLIFVQDLLCVRGYWNVPADFSKERLLQWFKIKIEDIGLLELKDTLYFPQSIDSEAWGALLPKGTSSFMVQPMLASSELTDDKVGGIQGFILLSSCIDYAFGEKDRAWIRAISNKFKY